MFKTIRTQLLLILLLFSITGIITSIVVFNYYIKSKDAVSNISNRIQLTHVLLLEDMNLIHEFLERETINEAFFESGQSKLVRLHNIKCREIEIAIAALNAIQEKSSFELNSEILKLKKAFSNYKALSNEIIKQIYIRGYKDYGIEGEMRSYAHGLEKYKAEIGLINVLQLRRHEKDYIMRQEKQYLDKHNELIGNIKRELGSQRKKSTTVLRLLDNYSDLFKRLALYEEAIGLKSGKGIKKEMDQISDNIKLTFNNISSSALIKGRAVLFKMQTVLFVIWIVLILFGIIAAWFISKKISWSIINLQEKISDFVKSDFTIRTILPIRNSENEIDILSLNFSIMEEQIVDQLSALKQTNKDLEMMFYKASHDINGPLASIKIATRQAIDNVSDPASLKYFAMIDKSRRNLNYIVDEIGMLTDIKNEAIQIEPTNLEELVRSSFRELEFMADYSKIIFSIQVNVKETFFTDRKLLKIVLRQLIENSIKYSNKNRQNPFVKITIVSEKNNIIRIAVSDNGIGIKKEFHEKIFEIFFRGTKEAHGAGLGLFIVHNSLQKLNGAVSVESEIGVGTTFTILLPNKIGQENRLDRIMRKREVFENEENLVFNYI